MMNFLKQQIPDTIATITLIVGFLIGTALVVAMSSSCATNQTIDDTLAKELNFQDANCDCLFQSGYDMELVQRKDDPKHATCFASDRRRQGSVINYQVCMRKRGMK